MGKPFLESRAVSLPGSVSTIRLLDERVGGLSSLFVVSLHLTFQELNAPSWMEQECYRAQVTKVDSFEHDMMGCTGPKTCVNCLKGHLRSKL